MNVSLENLLGRKEKLQQFFIPPYLEIFFPEVLIQGKKINLIGEFPRRVEQYEKIAECDGFYLNTPLAGIISIRDENPYIFSLKVSGKNQIANYFNNGKEIKNPHNLNKKDWFEFLNLNGLYSFEYKKSLAEIFQNSLSKIIFLLSDSYVPFFWQNLFSFYQKELMLLRDFLKNLYPQMEIVYYPEYKKKLSQRELFYNINNNKYHYRYIEFKNSHNSIVFSPATLFAIIRALYYNEPFTKNIFILKDYTKEQTMCKFFLSWNKF
ncbi:MAG: hypothetical protein KatS3mg068_2647 [Candidatus Sericytochromatia bacterium]|nr:MAG: hypothetical protein KatS3mg068_2647 [Candidatus Sericytochromatia bacterium]